MKTELMRIAPIALLVVISALTLSAQNTLPDPHHDGCWSSVSALQACQLQAYDQAQDQAQRCTSYPEYQCIPDYVSLNRQPSAKHQVNHVAQSNGSTAQAGVMNNNSADSQSARNTNLQ